MINRAIRTRLMMLGVFITTKINGSNKDIYLSAKEQKSKRAKKLAERLRQEKAPGQEKPLGKGSPNKRPAFYLLCSKINSTISAGSSRLWG